LAFLALVVGLPTSQARAEDDDTNAGAWSKFMQTLGLKRAPHADLDIDFTERSPLVVPPSRDLPTPIATGAAPAPDWPKDSNVKPRKHAKIKPAPAPAATTADGTVPAGPAQPPPPPYEKKTWYNPATWFNKEEYATFTSEPARDNLTDPPAGYRIPSPNEPYGIGPDKKAKPKTANATAAPAAAPASAPPAAPATAPAATQPATPPAAQPDSQTGK
jgi:hypothetical protein